MVFLISSKPHVGMSGQASTANATNASRTDALPDGSGGASGSGGIVSSSIGDGDGGADKCGLDSDS